MNRERPLQGRTRRKKRANSTNATLITEYLAYLRVEKGLRPLSCEAYESDLLQFAEFLESESATLLAATQQHIAGFLAHLAKHSVESRSAGAQALLPARILPLAPPRQAHPPRSHAEPRIALDLEGPAQIARRR